MKLIFHAPQHRKNSYGIVLMCRSVGWECEFTNDDSRLQIADYDLVIMNSYFLPIEFFPPNVKILYGPQHWVFPQGPLVGPPRNLEHKAAYNVLSEWNKITHEEVAGPLIVPRVCFPFGVDVDRFCPVSHPNYALLNECIVYVKSRHPLIIFQVCAFLINHGINKLNLFYYGKYDEEEYLKELRRVRFMVVIDAHESQGFALEEAMSCNVPLFVMDATSMHDEVNIFGVPTYEHMKPKNLYATSVPYWSDKCGVKFTNLSEMEGAFDTFIKKVTLGEFSPREFVLETLRPEVCMHRILDYFHF
jgi:hypothetical protein